jgi:hypothetical protein
MRCIGCLELVNDKVRFCEGINQLYHHSLHFFFEEIPLLPGYAGWTNFSSDSFTSPLVPLWYKEMFLTRERKNGYVYELYKFKEK